MNAVISATGRAITLLKMKRTASFQRGRSNMSRFLRIMAPVSVMYISCPMETLPIIKRVNSLSIVLPTTAGRNISTKPISIAGAAFSASGTVKSSSNPFIGAESMLTTGVYSEIIRRTVPDAIITGKTVRKKSIAVWELRCIICLKSASPAFCAPQVIACFQRLPFSGKSYLTGASGLYVSAILFSGHILGSIIEQRRVVTVMLR